MFVLASVSPTLGFGFGVFAGCCMVCWVSLVGRKSFPLCEVSLA
jgi:hypothetical protein